MGQLVWADGKWLNSESALLGINSEGLIHGLGLFETLRYENGEVPFLSKHLQRMRRGLKRFGIKNSFTQDFELLIKKTCSKNKVGNSARVKLYCFQQNLDDSILVISAESLEKTSPQKVRVGFSPYRINENSPLIGCKTSNYAFFQLISNLAKENGLDDVILFNQAGDLCETTRANIFFNRGQTFYTPSLETGCLPGIMREEIIERLRRKGFEVIEGKFDKEHFFTSDGVFLTNALRGVQEVYQVEGSKKEPQNFLETLSEDLWLVSKRLNESE